MGLRRFEWLELETDFLPGPSRLSLRERKSPRGRPMRQLSVYRILRTSFLQEEKQESFGLYFILQARVVASC